MAAATRARLRVVLLALALLTTCGQDLVKVSIGRCWAVSPGDRIEGTARLFAVQENDDCVECPSSLSGGAQCRGYDLRIADAVARANYDRVRQSAPADELGFVHPTVFVVGQVEAQRGGGRPVIRVTTVQAPVTRAD